MTSERSTCATKRARRRDSHHAVRQIIDCARLILGLELLGAALEDYDRRNKVQFDAHSMHSATRVGQSQIKLAVSGDRPQLARQEMVRRPRTADRHLAVLQLLGG